MIIKFEGKGHLPPWSIFREKNKTYTKESMIQYKYHIDDEFVGHLITDVYSKDMIEIKYFEVKDQYRSQGIGKQLFETFIADYPDKHIILECVPDYKTYNFYAKFNFVVFYRNIGLDVYHLIRPIPGTNFKSFIKNYQEEYYDDLYPEYDFEWAGTVWSREEERYIITDRTPEEELQLIINDEYMIEIQWVSKQTPEIQMIVARQRLDDALFNIRYPTRQLRLYALKQDPALFLGYFQGPCTEEEMRLAEGVYKQ